MYASAFLVAMKLKSKGIGTKTLKGNLKTSSIKGENVDSIVFLGPSEKTF